jgi:uncharacterized protein YjbJ (UPF0337 family)
MDKAEGKAKEAYGAIIGDEAKKAEGRALQRKAQAEKEAERRQQEAEQREKTRQAQAEANLAEKERDRQRRKAGGRLGGLTDTLKGL